MPVSRTIRAALLAALEVDDEGLKQRVDVYIGHVDEWSKAARRAQAATEARNGDAMLKAMGDETHHHSPIRFAIAEINSYCRGE